MAREGDRNATQNMRRDYDGPNGARSWESSKRTSNKYQDQSTTRRGVPVAKAPNASGVKSVASAAGVQARQAAPSSSESGMQYLKSTPDGTPSKPSLKVSSPASIGGATSSWAALLGGGKTMSPPTVEDAAAIASSTSVAAQDKPQPEPAANETQHPEVTSSPCSPRSFSFQRGNGIVLVHEAGPLSPKSLSSPQGKSNKISSPSSAAGNAALIPPSASAPPLSWAEKAKVAAPRAPFRKTAAAPSSNKQNTKALAVTSPPKGGQRAPRNLLGAGSKQQQETTQQSPSVSGQQRFQGNPTQLQQYEKTRATNNHAQPYKSNSPSKKTNVEIDASQLLKNKQEKKEAEAADEILLRPLSATTAPEAPSSSALPHSADIKEALDILCSSIASWRLPSIDQTTTSTPSLHHYYQQQQRVQPRGIKNPGNLCFVNAVLQGLMGSASFCYILLALRSLSNSGEEIVDAKTYPVLSAMVNVAAEFKKSSETVTEVDKTSTSASTNDTNKAKNKNTNLVMVLGGQPVSSALILEIINQFMPRRQERMEGQVEQEDAHEFLHFLLDKMDSELIALRKVVKKTAEDKYSGHRPEVVLEFQDRSFEDNNNDDGWLVKSGKKAVRQQEVSTGGSSEAASVITALFQGKFATSVACAGAPNSVTVHPFKIVELPIYDDTIRSLSDSLDALTVAEILEDYKPAAGAIPQQAAKTERFLHLPDVLILHLMRFQYAGKSAKIGKFVAFEPRFVMKSSWMATGTPDRGAIYNLAATVTHHGKTISRGHYTADVVQPDGKWLRFDDSDVYWVKEQQVLDDTPYLLVYERQR